MFKDRPDVLTPGRFYFAADNTPFLPFAHNFGSRNWDRDQWPDYLTLGESLEAKQKWYNGRPPDVIPKTPGRLGDPLCFSLGEGNTAGIDSLPVPIPPTPYGWPVFTMLCATDFSLLHVVYLEVIDNVYQGFIGDMRIVVTNDNLVVPPNGLPPPFEYFQLFPQDPNFLIGWDFVGIGDHPFGFFPSFDLTSRGFAGLWNITAFFTMDPPPGPCTPGFPADCFRAPIPHAPPGNVPLDISNRLDLSFLADVIAALYVDLPSAEALMSARFPVGSATAGVPNSGSLFPGWVAIKTADVLIVCIAGTSTPQQFSAQAAYLGQGLQDQGQFSTNDVWAAAAAFLHVQLSAVDTDPSIPIVLVGHSYGGAIAAILSARYKAFGPPRSIRLVTFGSPRVGDARYRSLADNVSAINLVNSGDLIAVLPPDILSVSWIAATVGVLLVRQWLQSADNGQYGYLAPDGALSFGSASPITLVALAQAALTIAAVDPLSAVNAHTIGEYARRIRP